MLLCSDLGVGIVCCCVVILELVCVVILELVLCVL